MVKNGRLVDYFKNPIFWLITGLSLCIVLLSAYIVLINNFDSWGGNQTSGHLVHPDIIPELIDLQEVIDEWVVRQKKHVAVEVYDLDHQRVVGEHNAHEIFRSASLYKLFVVYVDYIRISDGEATMGEEEDDNEQDKHFLYVGVKNKVPTYLTRAECLDLAIRESNSDCAERLAHDIGWENVTNKVRELGVEGTNPQAYSVTASGMNQMLQVVFKHQEISDDLNELLLDSMLNQPKTLVGKDDYYDWRQGLPSGFSEDAKVYDKVGWDSSDDGKHWTLYNDAAIVEIENHHYAITVLTEDTNPRELKALGAELEKAIKN